MRPLGLLAGTALIAGLFAGCSKNEIPQGEEVPLAPTANALGQKGELTFTVPEGWIEEQPSSPMRRAQFRLPGNPGSADAELAVFTGIGGSADQNIERWIGQFQDAAGRAPKDSAKITSREIAGCRVTFLDVSGTYSSGMMGPMGGAPATPKEGYRLLGAVLEGGDRPWFLKLTGPEDTVARWQESFEAYVSSAHR